jgi:hypothetical protein
LLTHYYKLDWTTDYGKTREKIYLAVKGKIKSNPTLYLAVRNVSELWHETSTSKIEKISKAEFMKNATGENIARFYSTLPEYNNLLNYSPKLWKQLDEYNWGDDYGKSFRKAKKVNNKKSVKNELKNLKNISNTKENEKLKNKTMER